MDSEQAAKQAAMENVTKQSEELTPEQKKALAKEKASVVLESLPKKDGAPTLTNDQGTNDAATLAAAISAAHNKPTKEIPRQNTPGSFAKKENPFGWNAYSSLPNPGEEDKVTELNDKLGLDSLINMYKGHRSTDEQQDLLAQFLNEAYYGEWYHNSAVMLFTVVFTWLLTRFGGGLMACLVVGAFLATYYQTSIRRLRRNIRDDIQRELAINRLETEEETAGWINHFMSRFWLIYEPVLSAQIVGIADSILIENTPSFLDSIRLSEFTLGTKAPFIEGIKTLTRTEPNVVCMDWKFSFVPNDVLDLSTRDLQSKINPKIILTIRVGKGMIGAGMPILLEDITFKGHLRLKFKMFNEFPHIKTVEASFLEKPYFDYSLKPVGGETFGFDINNIPGLQSFVQEQVHATLGPMMYAPNVFTLDVAGMMSGATDLDSANGVLIVKIHSASGLKDVDIFGSVDPYVVIRSTNSSNPELARTKHIEDNNNPRFDETLFILLNNINNPLLFEVMDRNVGRADGTIGVANFDLKSLQESDNMAHGLSLPVLRKGKTCGELKCDLQYFPCNLPDKEEDGTVIPPVESNSGVLRFTVHECKELGSQKKGGISIPIVGSSEISPYAVVKMNGMEKLRTKPFKRSINPRWDKGIEVFITDKTQLKLNVDILNSSEQNVLGRWNMSLEDFEEHVFIQGQDWWNLQDGAGKIHMSMQWKPITMAAFADSFAQGGYSAPIGVVRVKFLGANDLKNVEAMTGGKSDPYVRIKSSVQIRGQSEYIDDNLDPEWNQALYVPVHSIREDLIFEVMDYNDISKDKSLGICDFVLKDVAKQVKTDDQVIYEALAPVSRTVELTNLERKKGRGTLRYEASFHPTLALAKEVDDKTKKKEEVSINDQEESNSQASSEPELIEKPKEWPEKDLHGEVIKYTTTGDKKQIDLMAYESGVLSVTVHSVQLSESYKTKVELLLDSNDPQYQTMEQKGSYLEVDETGTVFVKEMDFSKLNINIKNVRDGDKDDKSIGRCSFDINSVVRRILEREQNETQDENIEEVKLLECPGGKIRVSFAFVPVIQFKLDPSESLENQGTLSVNVIRASNLQAADRGGTSDPFVRFYLEEQRVYKTETYKKTVNPVFNKDEKFSVPIVDRTVANLVAKVFDWDQIGKDTCLGECRIPFTGEDVETFQSSNKEIPLSGGGSITLSLLWRPELVARKRTNTSLFSATTRVFTSAPGNAFGVGKEAVGAGLGAGTKVFGAGTKVLGSGVSAIGSGFGKIGKIGKKSSTSSSLDTDSAPPVPTIPLDRNPTAEVAENAPVPAPTVSSKQGDQNSALSSSSDSTQQLSRSMTTIEDGSMVSVVILEARNLKAMDKGNTSDPYCRVRIGNKVVHKTRHIKKTLQPDWNESFTSKVNASKGVIDFKVKDHNTITDVDIGDHQFDLAQHVQAGQPFDGWLPLSPPGTGEIHVKVSLIDSDSVSVASKSGGKLFGMR